MADGKEEQNFSFHELNLDVKCIHFETHDLEESLQMIEILLETFFTWTVLYENFEAKNFC